jgi:hypothetical protein
MVAAIEISHVATSQKGRFEAGTGYERADWFPQGRPQCQRAIHAHPTQANRYRHDHATLAVQPTKPLMDSTPRPKRCGTPPKIRPPVRRRMMSKRRLCSTGRVLRRKSSGAGQVSLNRRRLAVTNQQRRPPRRRLWLTGTIRWSIDRKQMVRFTSQDGPSADWPYSAPSLRFGFLGFRAPCSAPNPPTDLKPNTAPQPNVNECGRGRSRSVYFRDPSST